MTKKLNRAPMELDLDSFLQSHSSSDDDDDLNNLPHRTIDEILNDSDSSSSSSPPSLHLPHFHPKPDKTQISFPKQDPNLSQDQIFTKIGKTPQSPEEKTTSLRNSYSLGRSAARPSPQLFGGVMRVNPKPGAALAAAAAASRSVATHAAAIKSRRANSDASLLRGLNSSEAMDSSGEVFNKFESQITQLDETVKKEEEEVVELVRDKNVNPDECERDDSDNSVHEIHGVSEESQEEETAMRVSLVKEEYPEQETISSHENDHNAMENESSAVLEASDNAEELHSDFTSHASEDQIVSTNGENDEMEGNQMVMGSEMPDSEEGEVSLSIDDTNLMNENTDVFEDKVQLDNEEGKKPEEKLCSSMKPLDLAEELEKKQAYSGLHWEEGAAAQPMRLEGIRRGPPAVGYLDIDANNAISRTLSSQAFRRDHGSPQVLAVHANFIAVGMSKGLTFIVSSKYSAQNADNMDAKMLLLAPQGDKSHSPVTSMCFNQQGDLLLAGYGNGHLIVWDMQRAAVAKVITGEHTAPVVHTLFLGQDSQVTRQFKAVTGDCKGLVLLHSFSVVPLLNRFSIKTQCLLDGQKTGIVLSASPLLMDDPGSLTAGHGNVPAPSSGIGSMMGGVVGSSLFNEGSSLVEEGVVIFVTHQTALVVRLSPNLEVYARLSKPDGVRDGSMPHTAWKWTHSSKGSSTESVTGETSDKASLLAIAWDQRIQIAKLVKSDLKVYREWTLDSAAIGVAWLDDQMLVILTLKRQFCLFSKEGDELHRTSFPLEFSGADDFIVHHTYFSNVSGNPAKAYNNSLAVRGATIYTLGPMHLVVSRLLPWKERIQVLRKAGDWMGALEMAMRLYDGHAHGVIDLPRTLDAIREAIMPYLVELILSYVDEVFSYISVAFCNQSERDEQERKSDGKSSVQSEMEDQFARVGGVAVEFCVHIKRIDILFDEIFSKFVAVQHGGTFLELLEPYILKDMLGCLPPEVMQALVEHYSSKGWLQRVEQCVLHMDISSLDFNQVVRLCREHGLYGALIYLFNKGLDDFKAPLEELLLVLQNVQSKHAAAIGYRMLVYLKYCFSGLSFPPGHGILPVTRLPSLRKELLQFLLDTPNERTSEVVTSRTLSTRVWPHLFHLLRLDTEATLEVLKISFAEDSNCENGLIDANPEEVKEIDNNTEDSNLMVQHTVNALVPFLDMSISDEDEISSTSELEYKGTWPSKLDIGHILEFIAHFVACKRATITKTVLNHVLEFLASENNILLLSQKIETSKRREKQMLALLRVVPETDWNSFDLLRLCENAQYHQVCGYIHTKRCQYVAALDCYMKDLDEPIHAFSFMNSMLLNLREAEYVAFQTAIFSRLFELVNLSREGTFLLVFDHFNKESEYILSELRSNPKSLFLYLKSTIEVFLSGTLNFSSLEKGSVMGTQSGSKLRDHSNEIEVYLERMADFPKLVRQNPVHITDEVVELYLELLCQYERNSVLKFLQTFDNYSWERCLRLCQEHGVIDAAAFLLERVGNVASALALTLSGLREKFHLLDSAVNNIVSSSFSHSPSEIHIFDIVSRVEEVNAVRNILHSSIAICQRNSKLLNPEESESLWFQLLDSFCEPLRDPYNDQIVSREDISGTPVARASVKEENETSTDSWRIPRFHRGAHILRKLFAQFIKEIVEGMIGGYVCLPTIMSKLLSDNGNQVFGDFKPIILGMLGTYGFEKRILDTAKSLIEEDTFCTMNLLKKGASHGYAPQNLHCHICSCPLTKDSTTCSIRIYNCGHTTHLRCEIQENGSSNAGGCPVCVPKKNTLGYKNKSVTNDNRLVRNSLPRLKQAQGANTSQHLLESDLVEKPYGVQQISRFEMLSSLKKSQRSLQIESLPQLRLAPPVVYHEKVQKKSNTMAGQSSSSSIKSEKPSRQLKELKFKKSALRFPLKSSIFGNDTTSRR